MKKLKKPQKQILVVTALALIALLLTVNPALSQVTGPCVDCHTMHNSQNATSMALDVNGNLVPGAGPFEKLLRKDGCIACHSGAYTAGGGGMAEIPKVLATSAPASGSQDYSAGGNFYWVATAGGNDDTKGHNVGYLAGSDGNFTNNAPPGYDAGLSDARGPFDATHQLTCAGVYGCHGDPDPLKIGDFASLAGAHHGVENANGFSDGTTIAKSYRFLYNIKGVEDGDWEYTTPSATDHNQYHGEDRAANTYSDLTTISHLCCECHGVFHTAAGATFASPWIRHPTDFDLSNATGDEYDYYNGGDGSDNDYSPIAPVAADMSALDENTSGNMVVENIFSPPTALGSAKAAIVTCISCHRAHGSEYADLLRWDYDVSTTAIIAGSGAGNVGCFICHTTKDDNS